MTKFKVGDKVKTIHGEGIIEICDFKDFFRPYRIMYSQGLSLWGDSHNAVLLESVKINNVEIPKTKSIMKKVSTFFKKMTDAKVQALSKAGYINGDLEPTQKATDAIAEIQFFAHYDALVALAEAEIKEEESKKD